MIRSRLSFRSDFHFCANHDFAERLEAGFEQLEHHGRSLTGGRVHGLVPKRIERFTGLAELLITGADQHPLQLRGDRLLRVGVEIEPAHHRQHATQPCDQGSLPAIGEALLRQVKAATQLGDAVVTLERGDHVRKHLIELVPERYRQLRVPVGRGAHRGPLSPLAAPEAACCAPRAAVAARPREESIRRSVPVAVEPIVERTLASTLRTSRAALSSSAATSCS
jgi:hypothetical protein